jgi:hypothetical protein
MRNRFFPYHYRRDQQLIENNNNDRRSLGTFLNRHKRKFIIGGVAIGAGIIAAAGTAGGILSSNSKKVKTMNDGFQQQKPIGLFDQISSGPMVIGGGGGGGGGGGAGRGIGRHQPPKPFGFFGDGALAAAAAATKRRKRKAKSRANKGKTKKTRGVSKSTTKSSSSRQKSYVRRCTINKQTGKKVCKGKRKNKKIAF